MSLSLILFGYRQKYAVGLWQELRTGVSRGVKSVCVRPSIRTIGRSKIFEGATTMNRSFSQKTLLLLLTKTMRFIGTPGTPGPPALSMYDYVMCRPIPLMYCYSRSCNSVNKSVHEMATHCKHSVLIRGKNFTSFELQISRNNGWDLD